MTIDAELFVWNFEDRYILLYCYLHRYSYDSFFVVCSYAFLAVTWLILTVYRILSPK